MIAIDDVRLKRALRLMKSVVPSRTTFPALLNVRLHTNENGQLEMYCADLARGMFVTIRIPVSGPLPPIAVGCAELTNLVATLSGEIVLDVQKHLVVTSGNSRSTFTLYQDLEDIPEMPAYGDLIGQMDTALLHNITALAAVTNAELQASSPIYIGDGHIAATNGWKKSATVIGLVRNSGLSTEATPPGSNLAKLNQFFVTDADIDIFVSTSTIVFDSGDVTFASSMINMPIPDFVKILDLPFGIVAQASKTDLITLFRRAALYTANYAGLEIKDGMLHLSARGDTTQHTDSIKVQCDTDIKFPGVNVRDWVSILPNLSNEVVTLKLLEENKPFVISDGVTEYLVAVMHLQ